MTDAPNPPPNLTNAIIGNVSGQVTQARDIIHISHGPNNLSIMNPRVVAEELTGMSPKEGVRALAAADVATSAAVLVVLLSLDEKAAIGLLTHLSRATAQAVIDAMESAPGWLKDLPTAADAIQRLELATRADLGKSTDVIARIDPDAFGQDFQNGHIYWTTSAGALSTVGEIGRVYDDLDGPTGWLGFPRSEDIRSISHCGTTGRQQWFEGGAIFVTEKFGAIAVKSDIADQVDDWRLFGFPMGVREASKSSHGTPGSWQHFETCLEYPVATVYVTPFGVFTVSDETRKLYAELDAERGWLGFPVADGVSDDAYRTVQRFEGGSIHWSPAAEPVAEPKKQVHKLPVFDGRPKPAWPRHGILAATSCRDGYQDLFMVTRDQRLVHRRKIIEPPFGPGAHWTWSPWRAMDEPEPVQAVTCCPHPNGGLEVFAVTADGGLLSRRHAGGRWAPWRVLASPGQVADLAAGLTVDRHRELVVALRNGHIAVRRLDGRRLPWASLTTNFRIVALARSNARGDVYALHANGRILHRSEAGEPWIELDGPGGECTAIAADSLHRYVVCDGKVFAQVRSAEWKLMTCAQPIVALACSSRVPGHFELCAVTEDGGLLHCWRWPSEGWTDWRPVEGADGTIGW